LDLLVILSDYILKKMDKKIREDVRFEYFHSL